MRYLLIVTMLLTQAAFASSVLPEHVYSACATPTIAKQKIKSVVDDELFFALEGNQLSWQKIKSTLDQYKIEKEPFKSTHGTNAVHQIAKITIDDNHLTYFVAERKQFPVCISLVPSAEILPSFTLLKQPLSFFQGKYNFDETVEQLAITTLEGGIKITLFFNKNVLTRFIYHTPYVD